MISILLHMAGNTYLLTYLFRRRSSVVALTAWRSLTDLMDTAVRHLRRRSVNSRSTAAVLMGRLPPTDQTWPDVTSVMTSHRRLPLPLPGRVCKLLL